MSDDELKILVTQYGLAGEFEDIAFRLAQEVERRTRRNYFALIQHANNAASAREITPRELDRMIWGNSSRGKT